MSHHPLAANPLRRAKTLQVQGATGTAAEPTRVVEGEEHRRRFTGVWFRDPIKPLRDKASNSGLHPAGRNGYGNIKHSKYVAQQTKAPPIPDARSLPHQRQSIDLRPTERPNRALNAAPRSNSIFRWPGRSQRDRDLPPLPHEIPHGHRVQNPPPSSYAIPAVDPTSISLNNLRVDNRDPRVTYDQSEWAPGPSHTRVPSWCPSIPSEFDTSEAYIPVTTEAQDHGEEFFLRPPPTPPPSIPSTPTVNIQVPPRRMQPSTNLMPHHPPASATRASYTSSAPSTNLNVPGLRQESSAPQNTLRRNVPSPSPSPLAQQTTPLFKDKGKQKEQVISVGIPSPPASVIGAASRPSPSRSAPSTSSSSSSAFGLPPLVDMPRKQRLRTRMDMLQREVRALDRERENKMQEMMLLVLESEGENK